MTITLSDLNFDNGRLSCNVSCTKENLPKELYFHVDDINEAYVNKTYDPMLVAIIPAAMLLQSDILIEGDIDSGLYENTLEAMALFNSWFPNATSIVNIKYLKLASREKINSHKVMSFYSGGIDSLFNIAGRKYDKSSQVDGCVLVHGMDIPLGNIKLWAEVRNALEKNINSIPNTKMLCVETNARDFQPNGVQWASTGFGPILGAICNFLSRGYDKALIGSYGKYNELSPHASGPLIDRLWSSDLIDVIHYSPRFSRLKKIEIIKDITPDLLQELRVCWKNKGGAYNCGLCEKCLRTKSELNIAGAEKLVSSFGTYSLKDDLKHLKGNIPVDEYTYKFWHDIALEIKDSETSSVIKNALKYYHISKIPYIFWLKVKKNIKAVIKTFR